MNKKNFLAILISLIFTQNIQANTDKEKHAIAGMAIYAGCMLGKVISENISGEDYSSWLNYKTCLLPVYVAGIGKEVYDSTHSSKHSPEFADVVSTVAIPTAIAGSIVLYRF